MEALRHGGGDRFGLRRYCELEDLVEALGFLRAESVEQVGLTVSPDLGPGPSRVMRRIGLPAGDLPDEALLSGFGDGDDELAVAFVRRFQSKVYGIALAVTGDTRTAEDVAQQVFERAWRHASGFDPLRGSVGTWLATITRNLAIDAVRIRRAVPVDADELFARVTAGPGSPPDPSEAFEAGTSAGVLRDALRELPIAQARAVVLAGIAGLSASEVAAAEGVPLGTAKSRIRAAMHRLRAILETREADHD